MTGWNLNSHLLYTDDFFDSSHRIVTSGNRFILNEHYFHVAVAKEGRDQEIALVVADPQQKDYNFKKVELGSVLKMHSFTILDTSEG
jgi:hypothetical protein